MKISIIAAVSQNEVIGRRGQLPWHLPDDLLWFKAHTMRKTLLMGKTTYESLPSKLTHRSYLVLSRSLGPKSHLSYLSIAHSMIEAFRLAKSCKELMVIGGSTVYRQLFPYASKIYLTTIRAEIEGDTYFVPRSQWGSGWYECTEARQIHPVDDRHCYPFEWQIFMRSHPERLPEV